MNKDFDYWIMLAGDICLLGMAYYFAYLLRFDWLIPEQYFAIFKKTVFMIIAMKIVFFFMFHLYRGMWQYRSILDLIDIVEAVVLSTVSIVLIVWFVFSFQDFQRSVFVLDFIITLFFIVGTRLGIRIFLSRQVPSFCLFFKQKNKAMRKLLLIGAGQTGNQVLREIIANPAINLVPVGFLDDDQNKLGQSIHGVPVLGHINQISEIELDFDEILITITSITDAQIKRIISMCKRTGKPFEYSSPLKVISNKIVQRSRIVGNKIDLLCDGLHLKENSYLLHFFATAIVFLYAYWGFETIDLVPQLINMVCTIILPGLALLSSLRNLKIEIPYMLGISIAIGLIFKSLLLFILSLVYFIDYYLLIMVVICVLCCCYVYINRSVLLINITKSRFDSLHFALYLGLFFGLAMVSSHYGRLFDSKIMSGVVSSPLLEKHSFMYTAYSLCTEDGLPWSWQHYECSWKIVHLPLTGLVVTAFSQGTNGNLLLGTFQCYFWGVFAVACMLAFCGAYLLNRYAGILAAIVFVLYFCPALRGRWQYFYYFPQLLSLLGCMVFLVVAINFAQAQSVIERVPVLLISLAASYVCLINNQFFMVFFSAASLYFLFMIINSKLRWHWFIWLLPITAMLLSFWFNVKWNGQVYPIEHMIGDGRKILIEYKPFQNLMIEVEDGLLSFKQFWYYQMFHLYQNSFGIGLLGALWLVRPLKRFKKLTCKSVHIFLWSGITISVVFGSTFFIEAGASSWYWYIFCFFFLFFYGSHVLCQNRFIGLLVIWIVIFGVTIFPNYYRLNQGLAHGSIEKEEYALVRNVAPYLPPKSRMLWLSDYSQDDNKSQLAFEWLTSKWCIYDQYYPLTTDGIDRASELYRRIKYSKISHIISPFSDLESINIGAGVNIRQIRKIEVNNQKKQNMYLYSLEYKKHFL